MKCLVCSKEYDGAECPYCRFPNVQINGDYDEGIRQLMPMINSHRAEYFGAFNLGIVLLQRKNLDSDSLKAESTVVSFGQVKDLMHKEKWLDLPIVAYPNKDGQLELTLSINRGVETSSQKVMISGFTKPDIINVGISVKDEYSICLMAKNKDNKTTGSSSLIRL